MTTSVNKPERERVQIVDGKVMYHDMEFDMKWFNVSLASLASELLGKGLRTWPDRKSVYKEFVDTFNIPAATLRKALRNKLYEVHIKPYEDIIYKYWHGNPRYFHKSSPLTLQSLPEIAPLIRQAEADGNQNIVPFILRDRKSPQELKKEYGKGLWKYYCSNSLHRNKLIAESSYRATWKTPFIKSVPSGVLAVKKILTDSDMDAINLLKRERLVCNKKAVRKAFNTIYNTKVLAHRLQLPLGNTSKYTLKDWMDKHGELIVINNRESARKRLEQDKAVVKSYEEAVAKYPQTLETGGYVFNIIPTLAELHSEGLSMQHCIGTYGRPVASGKYVVYTVKGNGERATLGITVGAEGLKFSQCYGKMNSRVSDALAGNCLKIIMEMNKEKFV